MVIGLQAKLFSVIIWQPKMIKWLPKIKFCLQGKKKSEKKFQWKRLHNIYAYVFQFFQLIIANQC